MQDTVAREQVSRVASFNGINVYKMWTDRFKTNTINIFFHDRLSAENAARNAIVPAVLRRGCERFKTFQDIALYLEELYGASFDCGVAKKGERQIMQFYIEYVSDRYTGEDTSLFEKAFDLLHEIVTRPFLENGMFRNDYIEQEKENLKKLIESRINDKVQYAVDKCFEEMCSDEPFGVYEYGSVKDLSGINCKDLYSHYLKMLETYPVDVFIAGDVEDEKIQYAVNKLAQIRRGDIKQVDPGTVDKEVDQVKNVVEKMSVSQGKLSLGFRTNTSPSHRDYYPLLVFNVILGGGMHSKLFQNVREKESLAYYAFSRLEKFKGLMVVSSGIEIKNKDRAQEIILKQIEDIKNGNISDYEYDATLKTIETGLKSLRDSQLQMVDFFLSQDVAGSSDDLDSLIEKSKKVSKQDVVNIAKKIKLDTVYFLTAK
ncbi:MAG: pitrilysin family protein [Clostridiales bacterium]|nr:insulinase family protein [Eubacteriales bacterium]MDH7564924.1 pitrilysin family protein [Clostridiales bacterium]